MRADAENRPWKLYQMIWAKRYLGFYNRLDVFAKPLIEHSGVGSRRRTSASFPVKRITRIDAEFVDKFNEAVSKMEFRPPFTLEEAVKRLADGKLFFVTFHRGEIVAWKWYTIDRVFVSEFDSTIVLRDGHGFSYNAYVSREHRGKRLNGQIMAEAEAFLKARGKTCVWALVFRWNVASQKSLLQAGYSRIGSYIVANVLTLKIHIRPAALGSPVSLRVT